jgi:ketosteroid isomerase-like protein
MSLTDELLATLESYADAYCDKNVDALMDLFGDGDEISVIGTGADELCAGRDQVRALFSRNFAEATATRFEFGWTQATVEGTTGVVATTLTIHLDLDGRPVRVPIRWTVAATRAGDRWVWLHRHASSAAGSQRDGAAYPDG